MPIFSPLLGALLAATVAAVPSPRQSFGFEPGADRELFD
jgi:hypothetical protein